MRVAGLQRRAPCLSGWGHHGSSPDTSAARAWDASEGWRMPTSHVHEPCGRSTRDCAAHANITSVMVHKKCCCALRECAVASPSYALLFNGVSSAGPGSLGRATLVLKGIRPHGSTGQTQESVHRSVSKPQSVHNVARSAAVATCNEVEFSPEKS